ncbi:NUDIX hydrolase [Arthrobacter sp. Z1-15]
MLHGTAATVVLLRDDPEGMQVLLLERPRHRGSFAGAWVFPGGVVDPGDAVNSGTAVEAADGDDANLASARRAGVRETAEETGLVLQPQQLVRLSCWVPPPEAPRRWKTEFFLAPAPAGDITLSPEEHVDAVWLTPAEALRRGHEGTMDLVPPTWVTLHGLLGRKSVAEALAAAAAAVPETYATRMLPGREPSVMVWPGDPEYPDTGEDAGEDMGEDAGEDMGEDAGEDTGETADASARHRLVRDGTGWIYQRTT